MFCTRTSTGTNNAVVATLYCSSAEQFQELGWDLKSQSKSRGFCIPAPLTPLPALFPPLHFPCTGLSGAEGPSVTGCHKQAGPWSSWALAALLSLSGTWSPTAALKFDSLTKPCWAQGSCVFTSQLQERKRDSSLKRAATGILSLWNAEQDRHI